MRESLVNKVFSFLIVSLILFFMYCFSIVVGEDISTYLLDFSKDSIYSFIASIFCSSGFVFFITLLIHYIYQLIPILNIDNFYRQFHAVHLIYLYISGLITVLSVMEPILMEGKILGSPIQGIQMAAAILVFFIIMSNYYLYNSIVINDDLYLNRNKNLQIKPLTIKYIYYCLAIIISPILIIRMFNMFITKENQDYLTIILFACINFPYLFKWFRNSKSNIV